MERPNDLVEFFGTARGQCTIPSGLSELEIRKLFQTNTKKVSRVEQIQRPNGTIHWMVYTSLFSQQPKKKGLFKLFFFWSKR